ncbi:MAG TPA: fibronectin type III domain-containing protein [Pyrinomonadaceae bacterium]|nr:fibronectin type III domain-containing protein [Pyrinomonadaceae bacterium]
MNINKRYFLLLFIVSLLFVQSPLESFSQNNSTPPSASVLPNRNAAKEDINNAGNISSNSLNQNFNSQSINASTNINANTNVNTNTNIEPKKEATENPKIKYGSFEVSGFPTWISLVILISLAGCLAYSVWAVPKAAKENSISLIVIGLIISAVVFFFAGRLWDRWWTSSESQQKVRVAVEEEVNKLPPAIPASPSYLTVSPVSDSRINLSWSDNSLTEDGFKIERRIGSEGKFAPLLVLGPNATSYADIGLSAESTVFYRLKAFNAQGESEPAYEASGTTPARLNSQELSWSDPRTTFLYIILPIFVLMFTLITFWTFLKIRTRIYSREYVEDLERRIKILKH